MVTLCNPQIVTDGLVLCLDAANKDSYPGTGTVWTDLSGNGNDGTLTNGPTFDINNGGNVKLDGTNDIINLNASDTYKVQFPLSINIIFKINSFNTYTHLFKTDNPTDGWYSGIFSNIYYTGNISQTTINIHYGNNGYPNSASRRTYITNYNFEVNKWYNFCTILPNNSVCNSYLNGNKILTPFANGSATNMNYRSNSTPGALGFTYVDPSQLSQLLNGNIALFYIYNRALTENEVLQNYKATKSRFGL